MLIAGNWKMNLNFDDLIKFKDLISKEKINDEVEIAIFPQFPLLSSALDNLDKFKIKIGAQTCSSHLKGAYTGDVSVEVLSRLGCKFCLVGHSERRKYYNETNEFIKKTSQLLSSYDIIPIVCIGESIHVKEKNQTIDFILKQVRECVPKEITSNLVIAYEPIWSIGTGQIPEYDEISLVHDLIFNELSYIDNLKIIYGGSVNLSNCKSILNLDNIHGALIGGSSLVFEDFIAIYQTAVKQVLNKF